MTRTLFQYIHTYIAAYSASTHTHVPTYPHIHTHMVSGLHFLVPPPQMLWCNLGWWERVHYLLACDVVEEYFPPPAEVVGVLCSTLGMIGLHVRLEYTAPYWSCTYFGEQACIDGCMNVFCNSQPSVQEGQGLTGWACIGLAFHPGALFSGLQAASVRAATYGTARIGLCEPLQEVAGRSGGAVIAGVLATVVGNPFEALFKGWEKVKVWGISNLRDFMILLFQEIWKTWENPTIKGIASDVCLIHCLQAVGIVSRVRFDRSWRWDCKQSLSWRPQENCNSYAKWCEVKDARTLHRASHRLPHTKGPIHSCRTFNDNSFSFWFWYRLRFQVLCTVLRACRSPDTCSGLPVLASGFGWAAARSSLLTVSQVVPYVPWHIPLTSFISRAHLMRIAYLPIDVGNWHEFSVCLS